MHETSNPSQLHPAFFFFFVVVVSLQVKHFKSIQGIRVWDSVVVHNSAPD